MQEEGIAMFMGTVMKCIKCIHLTASVDVCAFDTCVCAGLLACESIHACGRI